MTDHAKRIWLHAIAIVAKARNKCAPGERFEALNLVMGDLEDARRRDQLIMPDFPAVCPDCGPDCETHNGESDCAALQPGEAQEDDRTAALQRVRQIALQSETAPLSMCEIIKRVGIALGEETPLPDWFFAAIKDAPPATQVTATDLERIAADFEKDSNLDRYICCNGRDCGCQGATAGAYAAYKIRALAGDGK